MTTVGIRELKAHASDIVRRVETGEQVAITNHGRIVARIVPAAVTPEEIKQSLAILDDLDGEDEAWASTPDLESVMDDVRR